MDTTENIQHVFIIGCKGIPASYGGYETFVEKLTQYRKSTQIKYHVSCGVDDIYAPAEFEYNDAHCFNIKWRKIGSARSIIYDIDAIEWSLRYVQKNHILHPVFYILACRIGPFMFFYRKKIKAAGGTLYLNPDGHEWLRAKWPWAVRCYWKISEKLMVKEADMVICDSKNIEKYINESYKEYHPKTSYIAYGAETNKSKLMDDDEKVALWYEEKGTKAKNYYLVVGRFVPENNYETMIKEFMISKTNKHFVLITGVTEKFLEELKTKTGFDQDPRIKFVGTVYDQELLKKIRENAYGYFHGHEVGGTNPSLLEALGSTDLNLLLDVGFNREVGEDGALYWTKENGNLAKLIDKADIMSASEVNELGKRAHKRINDWYSWDYIVEMYENCFENNNI